MTDPYRFKTWKERLGDSVEQLCSECERKDEEIRQLKNKVAMYEGQTQSVKQYRSTSIFGENVLVEVEDK